MDTEHLLHCPTLNHEAQQTKDLVSLYWEAREKMIKKKSTGTFDSSHLSLQSQQITLPLIHSYTLYTWKIL
jgi:urease accessory protein UreE